MRPTLYRIHGPRNRLPAIPNEIDPDAILQSASRRLRRRQALDRDRRAQALTLCRAGRQQFEEAAALWPIPVFVIRDAIAAAEVAERRMQRGSRSSPARVAGGRGG